MHISNYGGGLAYGNWFTPIDPISTSPSEIEFGNFNQFCSKV